jgi:hypothetical protein
LPALIIIGAILAISALIALLSPASQKALALAMFAALKPIAAPFLDLFNSPLFVVFSSSAIFISALAVCWFYWSVKALPAILEYDRFKSQLSQEIPAKGIEKRTWADIGSKIDDVAKTYNVFPTAWAMLFTSIDNQRRIPAKPFAAYVAEDPIIAERENGSFMRSLSTYYVTFGLILTFIGLVAALYFASKGFRSGNMEDARKAITDLLNAASFKFLTSVAALLASFIISIFGRWADGKVRAARNSSVIAVETLLKLVGSLPASADPILAELTAIREELQKTGRAGPSLAVALHSNLEG